MSSPTPRVTVPSGIRSETPTEVAQGVGRDEDWSATVAGSVCGVVLPGNPVAFASVQTSRWVNVVRTPKP